MFRRLFQIVYLLMHEKIISAEELAKKLEVSERTIYRDLDKLSEAGIPIYTNRGRGGGISLLSDFVLDKTVLTEEEKAKIITSLQAFTAVGYQQTDQNPDVLQNVSAFFGSPVVDWIEVDFSDWTGNQSESELFQQLKTAILRGQYLQIRYSATGKDTMLRRIKPLKLCFRSQAWYLYAFCEYRKDYRFFKLHRISEIIMENVFFPLETVGKLIDTKKRNMSQNCTKVTIEIDSDAAYRAYDELKDITQSPDGKIISTIDVPDMEWFLGYMLTYGQSARVIEPESVIKLLKERIHQISHMYD